MIKKKEKIRLLKKYRPDERIRPPFEWRDPFSMSAKERERRKKMWRKEQERRKKYYKLLKG